jgi:hypothetical protein
MDEEARYVTKFFFDDGVPVKIVIARLRQHYRKDAISPPTVYYWVKQVRLGRKDRSFKIFQYPDENAMMELLMPSPTDL